MSNYRPSWMHVYRQGIIVATLSTINKVEKDRKFLPFFPSHNSIALKKYFFQAVAFRSPGTSSNAGRHATKIAATCNDCTLALSLIPCNLDSVSFSQHLATIVRRSTNERTPLFISRKRANTVVRFGHRNGTNFPFEPINRFFTID